MSDSGVPYVVKVCNYGMDGQYVEKSGPVYIGEITYKNFEPSPEGDFRLSYYGFPEPDFGPRKIGWVRMIGIALGVGMIFFALWSMHQQRRSGKNNNAGKE